MNQTLVEAFCADPANVFFRVPDKFMLYLIESVIHLHNNFLHGLIYSTYLTINILTRCYKDNIDNIKILFDFLSRLTFEPITEINLQV